MAGFVGAMKVNFGDISVVIDIEGEPGVADSGHLDFDLGELPAAVGEAAKAQGAAVALFIDELQCTCQEFRM